MEQVEGGDLVVNKGHESKPREASVKGQRNLNAVDGLDTAIKLAEVLSPKTINFMASLTIYRQTSKNSSKLRANKPQRRSLLRRTRHTTHTYISGYNLSSARFLFLYLLQPRTPQTSQIPPLHSLNDSNFNLCSIFPILSID